MITIISGTNRKDSNTLKVAKYYQKELSKRGLVTELFSLLDLPENLINTD